MEIRAINTILYCNRWEETVAFYRSVLGGQESHATGWFVEFPLGDTARLSVADAAKTSIGSSAGRGITISLRVKDVVSAHAELVAAGLDPTEPKDLWGTQVTYIYDPEGHRIEFWT